MIIGETFNNEYDRYEEDSYDYLFKRKSKEERQQKKAERKEKRTEKKQVRQEKKLAKQDPTTGGKKKLQIFGNFGLFDKNKNKNKTAGSTTIPSSSAKTGSASGAASSSSGESKPAQDNTDSASSSSAESGAGTEGAKMEGNTQDTGGSPKKEAGMGAVFGFVALGLVVTIIGVVLFRVDKKSNPAPQPLKVAA